MHMRSTWIRQSWPLLSRPVMSWAIIALFSNTIFGQPPQPKVITWGAHQTSSPQYFGVLGEVARPAVYRSDSAATLQEIVRFAGGLTAGASRSIRIVRGERGGQTLYFSETRQDLLQNGDFVVVDVERSPQDLLKPRAAPQAGQVVYIGFLGVQNRPVVQPMEPEAAHLSNIMLGLGQSRELARSARLLLPLWASTAPDLRAPLPSGTIIALPQTLLVATQLPTFPEAIPLIESRGEPSLTTPQNGPEIALPLAPDFGPPPADPTDIVVPAPVPPVDPSQLEIPPLPLTSRDVTASTLPFSMSNNSGQATPTNPASMPRPGTRLATTINRHAVVPAPAPPATDNILLNEASASDEESADLVGVPGEIVQPATFNLWQLLGIGATVVTLMGVALGTRTWIDRTEVAGPTDFGRRQSTLSELQPVRSQRSARTEAEALGLETHEHDSPASPEKTASPEKASSPQKIENPEKTVGEVAAAPASSAPRPIRLSMLLANSLPLEIEPPAFPESMKLQGIPASIERSYRVDEAVMQSPGAPHMPLPEKSSTAIEFALDDESEMRVPRPHFFARKPTPSEHTHSNSPANPVEESEEQALNLPEEHSRSQSPQSTIATPAPQPGSEVGKTSVERALSRIHRGRRS